MLNEDMDRPLVSVCIITYNHGRFIAQAIESVLRQETNFPYEIIIGDDHSTDHTVKTLNDYLVTNPSIIKLNLQKKNVGVVTNFVTTFNLCSGEYVSFLEGDDFWTDHKKLQKQVDLLSDNKDVAICFSDCIIVDENNKIIANELIHNLYKRDLNSNDLVNFTPPLRTVMLKRKYLQNYLNRIPSSIYNLDHVIFLVTSINGDCKYMDEKLAAYRVHEGGIYSPQNKDFRLRMLLETMKYLLHEFKNELSVKNITNVISSVYYQSVLNYCSNFKLIKLIKIIPAILYFDCKYHKITVIKILYNILIRMKDTLKTLFSKIKFKIFKNFVPNRYREEMFSKIYKTNSWGDDESFSGTGSNLGQTSGIIELLPQLFKKYSIKTVLDIPCGDFNWMKHVDFDGIEYIGADIVKEIIKNNQKYSRENIKFVQMDIISSNLPKVDLIFSRDCLVHFSNEDILKTLNNIKKSGSTYLLTTTFPDHHENMDIKTGKWRTINLEQPPFDLNKPLEIIREECTEDDHLYYDKSLALWEIKDING